MEHNKLNWDKLQAISVLTSDSPKLGPALKKNPYIYAYNLKQHICSNNEGNVDTCMHKT